MFKFQNREKGLEAINKWLSDGSALESWGSYPDDHGLVEWVVLRGKDGAREEFYIFASSEDYDAAHNYDPWEG